MGYILTVFLLVLGGAFKKLWLPAVLVIAAVTAIAFFSGGSALWAAGITTVIALVVIVIASISGTKNGWH